MPVKYLPVKAAAKIFANQRVMSKVKVFLRTQKKEKKIRIILRTTKQNMNYSYNEFEKNPKSS